jgi:hypothetical protein
LEQRQLTLLPDSGLWLVKRLHLIVLLDHHALAV